jgi:hypothetical protein
LYRPWCSLPCSAPLSTPYTFTVRPVLILSSHLQVHVSSAAFPWPFVTLGEVRVITWHAPCHTHLVVMWLNILTLNNGKSRASRWPLCFLFGSFRNYVCPETEYPN